MNKENTKINFKRLKNYGVLAQFFPENRRGLRSLDVFYTKQKNLFDKDTKVVSIGSCFAAELARYMVKNDYNYLITEQPMKGNRFTGSAAWQNVYNTSCMRQIFEYSFTDVWSPVERWWKTPNRTYVADPYRELTKYKKTECETLFLEHALASKKALESAELIIITLGLIEVWRNKKDKMVFSLIPKPYSFNSKIHEFHLQTIEECLSDLKVIYNLLKTFNSSVNIVVSVSPVPLLATFRTDVNVVVANMFSKSILRLVAEEFCMKENVFYFPSYEIVTSCLAEPFKSDARHVKKDTVKILMSVFEYQFGK